jgi:uncharacterized protein (DUF608 family)
VRQRDYNGGYAGEQAARIAYPLGGIGAGMVCIDGGGALTQVSVRNRPELLHEPLVFAAVSLKMAGGVVARLLEGPTPAWKVTYPWPDSTGTGRGQQGKTFGLPRFAKNRFTARFPFAQVDLEDAELPVRAQLTAWSPFVPGDEDSSSLPVAALEYLLTNTSAAPVEGVFSYHARNFLAAPPSWTPPPVPPVQGVRASARGFTLFRESPDAPADHASFSIESDAPEVRVNARWFRGAWWDPVTDLWRTVARGDAPEAPAYEEGPPSAGGSLYAPFALAPGEQRRIGLRLAWYAPESGMRRGGGPFDPEGRTDGTETFRPWYAGRFASHTELDAYWRDAYDGLRAATARFSDTLYDTTLPAEVMEAVGANLTILKSPTTMRQTDGRLWLWEGCADKEGSFEGSCTHVFNYAQAVAHLFPRLERSLRETEFFDNQDETGHQNFRAQLPIRPNPRRALAAADGQLGGILKVYRDWRICGDETWLRRLWPQVRASLDYCIRAWDPAREGWLTEPHHNTYDIEFWGPDGMCGSIYLAALRAAVEMGETLREPVEGLAELAGRAKAALEGRLFNGEYYVQQIRWDERAHKAGHSPETRAIIEREGPKYQYGEGCLSDGIIGEWFARVCGLGPVLDPGQVRSHLTAVHRYNFKTSLRAHANPQRPAYALGDEAALLLCSWPRGGALSFPFVYSDEAWTGIEYQVAGHLILSGAVDAGLQIVRAARDRYDGRVRNPFSEFEWGHWYGRALSSYALLQAFTGQDYDARTGVLRLAPAVPGDVRAFLATETGYGLVGVRDGEPFLDVRSGRIEVSRFDYRPAS